MSTLAERRLAAEIAGLRRELRASTTTTQLAHSSVENGSITFRDTTGREVMDVGPNPDGSFGATPRIGVLPPTPANVTVIPTPGGMTVRWDGTFTDSLMTPDDWSRAEVHVVSDPLTPTDVADNLVGTIESPRGGDVVVTKLVPGTTYWAVLYARNTAGGRGPASDMASGVPLTYPDGPGTAQAISAAEEARRRAQEAQDAAAKASQAANAADASALDAASKATKAQASADGKSTLWHAVVAPMDAQGKPGDLWWQRDSPTGPIVHVYERQEAGWVERTLSSSTIDSITAGQITTGTLAAGQLIRIGELTDTHVLLGESSIRLFRPDGDGGVQTTISIGGADRDVIQITDPTTGATLAGFDGEGGGVADSFTTNTLTVGGMPIGYMYEPDDALFQLPRGRIAGYRLDNDSIKVGASLTGISEIGATCYSYRLYRIRAEGNFATDATGKIRLAFWVTTDGSTPAVGQRQLTMRVHDITSGIGAAWCEGYFFVGASSYDEPITVRALFGLQKISGGGTVWVHSDSGVTPGYLTIEDIGAHGGVSADIWGDGQTNTGGATPVTGTVSVPTTAKRKVTKTYQAAWTRTWRGSSVESDPTLRQGTYSSTYRSAMGFAPGLQSDLAGASIQSMQLQLTATHWGPDSGGTAALGAHGSASAPAAFPASSGSLMAPWASKSGPKLINIPSAWWPFFVSGVNKGFTLQAPSSALEYYGKIAGANSTARPKLTVTYLR